MAHTSSRAHKLARRAYELSRARVAFESLWIVVPMVVASIWVGKNFANNMVIGGALAVITVACLWYGRSLARATWPGLIAGILPMALPLAVYSSGFCCAGLNCQSTCMAACVIGATLAGGALGYFVMRNGKERFKEIIPALLIAGIVGSLGCTMMPPSAMLGMLATLIAGAMAGVLVSLPSARLSK